LGDGNNRLAKKGKTIPFIMLGAAIAILASYLFFSDTSQAKYGFRCGYWSIQLGDKLNGSAHTIELDNELRRFETECTYPASSKLKPSVLCSVWSNEIDAKGEYLLANIDSISNNDLVEFVDSTILFEDKCSGIPHYTSLEIRYPAFDLF
jgi:hypothetical protein